MMKRRRQNLEENTRRSFFSALRFPISLPTLPIAPLVQCPQPELASMSEFHKPACNFRPTSVLVSQAKMNLSDFCLTDIQDMLRNEGDEPPELDEEDREILNPDVFSSRGKKQNPFGKKRPAWMRKTEFTEMGTQSKIVKRKAETVEGQDDWVEEEVPEDKVEREFARAEELDHDWRRYSIEKAQYDKGERREKPPLGSLIHPDPTARDREPLAVFPLIPDQEITNSTLAIRFVGRVPANIEGALLLGHRSQESSFLVPTTTRKRKRMEEGMEDRTHYKDSGTFRVKMEPSLTGAQSVLIREGTSAASWSVIERAAASRFNQSNKRQKTLESYVVKMGLEEPEEDEQDATMDATMDSTMARVKGEEGELPGTKGEGEAKKEEEMVMEIAAGEEGEAEEDQEDQAPVPAPSDPEAAAAAEASGAADIDLPDLPDLTADLSLPSLPDGSSLPTLPTTI